MFISSAVAMAGIAVWQTLLLSKAGVFTGATIAIGISAPLSLVLALTFMAMKRFSHIQFALKALAGAVFASLACLPSFIFALKDDGLKQMFQDAFIAASTAINAELPDTEQMWEIVKTGVASSFGAILFMFLFASAWIGTRFGKTIFHQPSGTDEASLPPALTEYHLPPSLVWVLLASWASLLLARFYPSLLLSAVASNATIALSICYGVQGLAVAGAVAERAGLATVARLLGPVAIILLLVGGTAGLIVAGAIALVGTLETWIPFRAVTKGDSP
jgi:hypothetical protein